MSRARSEGDSGAMTRPLSGVVGAAERGGGFGEEARVDCTRVVEGMPKCHAAIVKDVQSHTLSMGRFRPCTGRDGGHDSVGISGSRVRRETRQALNGLEIVFIIRGFIIIRGKVLKEEGSRDKGRIFAEMATRRLRGNLAQRAGAGSDRMQRFFRGRATRRVA